MSWRTVVITRRCKLDLRMGYLVIRADDLQRIFLEEIALLIIENPAVSLTGLLLEALNEHGIRVIFCNSKRSPMAELMPLYGSHDCAGKCARQLSWGQAEKMLIWTYILEWKLRTQAVHLRDRGRIKESDMLHGYLAHMEFGDLTNREGHAAKVYFNALFGKEFSRSANTPFNAALNYGYGILLSAFNRTVSANGYLTQIGLHHCNVYNPYNLSSDIMEPFRALVDRKVYEMDLSSGEFGSKEKHYIVSILADEVVINNSKQTVLNAVRIYVKSVFDALNAGDVALIKMYKLR